MPFNGPSAPETAAALAHALRDRYLLDRRFHREIRVTAALQHPNILPVFDSGRTAGYSWYTMPYVAGESLRRRLERGGPLPLAEAIGLAREIADALAYAHGHGVVHRDIKPENILLSGGHALVADFGVARLLETADAGLTVAGVAIGSPASMSPEQAVGEPVDGRSDIYALGCVLFEMLAGRTPFTGVTAIALMSRRLVEAAPELRGLRPDAPSWLEIALRRALAREPAGRYSSAAAGRSGTGLDRARRRLHGAGLRRGRDRQDLSDRRVRPGAAVGAGALGLVRGAVHPARWRRRSGWP